MKHLANIISYAAAVVLLAPHLPALAVCYALETIATRLERRTR